MTRFDTDRFTAELSPDFEGVVRALEQSIAQARSGGRPIERLSPVHVLVPSPQWEEALSRELAHQHGAEGNLRFRRLEPFVRDVVRESLDPDADGAYRLLGGDEYTNLILREFVRLDESGDWGETSLDACRRYIDGQESELELGEDVERVTRARRRYQLADEVGGRFYQYSVSRPEIFEAWAEGRSIFDGAEDVDDTTVGIEEWQRALWCRTVGDDRQVECEVDGRSQTFVTLPRAVELIEASEELEHGAGDELGTAPLFAVGFPAIGRSFLRALAVVADRGEGVRLFGLDPARAWTGGVDGESSGAVGDICEHWSDVGRVTAGVFEDVTGESPTWEGSGDDRSDDTTLERVRDASTEPDPGDRVEAADVGADERPSIRFDGAPNPHREVEIAANRIWQLLHEEDELRPADVAVAVPSSVWASYLSLIRSIFPAFERLPFAVHAPLGHRGSRVLRAVEALLELTEGRFHRNSMLPVLTHPNVGGRLAGSVSDWREWVDSLGIVDGGDARDHESTYVSGDRLNWRQGARRLALGTVLSRAESDDPREHWDERAVEAAPGPFDDAQTYPAEYVPAGGIGSAAGCLSLARSLIADVRWLTG
ncbi:MAG: exodeoxyribonuclease V subunit gamma, partial [Bradymonadaceae bacterium]